MSGPVTGLQIRSTALHASAEALETGERVEDEIPEPTAEEGFLPCAFWWLDAGYVVFPLYPANEPIQEGDSSDPAKKPNGRLVGAGNGVDTIGSTEVEQIRAWWRQEPLSGVAIVAPTSGVLIVDIDPKNNGWHTFLPWCEANGIDLSEVPRSQSPRGDGGVHLYWRLPEGATYTFGRFMRGVDRPWQVPVPPSPRWVQTGEDRSGRATHDWRNYTWLAGDPRALPEAPAALLSPSAASPGSPAATGDSGNESILSGTDDDGVLPTTEFGSIDHSRLDDLAIPVGDQNKAFKRIACSMVRYHATNAEIVDRLLYLSTISPVGDPRHPWTRTDMERITRHARDFVDRSRQEEAAAAEAARAEGIENLERIRRLVGM